MKKSVPVSTLALFFVAAMYLPNKANAQLINTMAGNGTVGFSGDGGQATAATTDEPEGVTVDPAGNVYIADESNNRIRKVTTAGIISTIAGNGAASYGGDGGPATAGSINGPDGLRFDHLGNLFVADANNERARKISTSGIITTLAGNGTGGFSGDGGQATAAELSFPTDVCSDLNNNIYIADYFNNRVRRVATTGIITTFGGNGVGGFSGDGGQATAAEMSGPYGVRCDAAGNIYVAEYTNHRIRMINTSGVIKTVAGTGVGGFSGDGGQATAAQLDGPVALTFDAVGNYYIADYINNRIRKVTTAGVISTYAGNGVFGYSGDGGPATAAEMEEPIDVEMNKTTGCLYEADWIIERVRVVCGAPVLPVTLMSFDAEYRATNNDVQLNWATATETNNKFFTVERQTGGDNWEQVTTVAGAGTSSETHYYTALDENPYPGTSYYRIKQTDYDGDFTYSDIRVVTVLNYNYLNIVPNPVRDNFNLNYNALNEGEVNIRVFSISGAELIPSNKAIVQKGMNIIPVNSAGLGSGMYIMQVNDGTQTYYKKFIKQ